jgi:hypothetical protein
MADIQVNFISFIMIRNIDALECYIQQHRLDIREVRRIHEQVFILRDYISPTEHLSTVPELDMLYSLESQLQGLELALQTLEPKLNQTNVKAYVNRIV